MQERMALPLLCQIWRWRLWIREESLPWKVNKTFENVNKFICEKVYTVYFTMYTFPNINIYTVTVQHIWKDQQNTWKGEQKYWNMWLYLGTTCTTGRLVEGRPWFGQIHLNYVVAVLTRLNLNFKAACNTSAVWSLPRWQVKTNSVWFDFHLMLNPLSYCSHLIHGSFLVDLRLNLPWQGMVRRILPRLPGLPHVRASRSGFKESRYCRSRITMYLILILVAQVDGARLPGWLSQLDSLHG